MRFVIYGVGAIGGTVAAALVRSGREVIGIARGEHLRAMQNKGLTVRTPNGTWISRFKCVAGPAEIDWRSDDAILLGMKTQDTLAALDALQAAGVREQPIFCMQNGVANESLALRRFANVHGITVIMPADYVVPGEVAAFGAPKHGIFDLGRFPRGSDSIDDAVASALTDAGIVGLVSEDIMQYKYGKLLMNLHNIVEASMGDAPEAKAFSTALRAEGEAVLAAAGITWREVGHSDPRREGWMKVQPIEGVARTGSSSTQSLARATGSIETDYLNGEIVLLGRLHNVPTPLNTCFAALGAHMARHNIPPGRITPAEVASALGS